jgi:hypothetical protein
MSQNPTSTLIKEPVPTAASGLHQTPLPIRSNNPSEVKIKDSDGNDLTISSWYKIRFPDGSELSAGQRDDWPIQETAYEAVVKPPNCGPAVSLQGITSLSEGEDAQLVGHVTFDHKPLTLHLSLNKAGNQLHW